MKRREFVTLAGGVAAMMGPLTARAQTALPIIGFVNSAAAAPLSNMVDHFRRGLGEAGYIEGQNVKIEYRFAEGHYDRLPSLVTDLVNRQVSVIVATGGTVTALAARAATSTIPVVFITDSDPVKIGLVASLNRPGGNLTGVHQLTAGLEAKRFGFLHELVPKATNIAVLVNPDYPDADAQVEEVQRAARQLGVKVHVLRANSEETLESSFAAMIAHDAAALLVASDPFFFSRRSHIVGLAARYTLPAIYQFREFATLGGLMSYGTHITSSYRQAGIYSARMLRGEKPSDLPVIQSAKFEFVINMRTGRSLGISLSPALLAQADEVIE